MDWTDQQTDPSLDLVAEWLTRPVTVEEVAGRSWADLWLKDWFAMLARMEPGDELWEYDGEVEEWDERTLEPAGVITHAGYARVRDGRVLEYLPTEEHCY